MSEIISLLAFRLFHYLPSLETLKASQMLEEQQPLRDLGYKFSLRSEMQRLIIFMLMAQN